jgi:CRP-like cAMP-binding protein
VPYLRLPAGRWADAAGARPAREPVVGAVVLKGLIARETRLAGRTATQLLGAGEVCNPWARDDELLPSEVAWSALEPSCLAVLDGRFAAASRRWPSLGLVVQQRLAERADRLASLAAVLQLPTVEQRVLAVLWHLADRFGRVTTEGVAVRLRLTHQLLGRLVGAERPTVTLALGYLAASGAVVRRDNTTWLLDPASRETLAPRSADPAAA